MLGKSMSNIEDCLRQSVIKLKLIQPCHEKNAFLLLPLSFELYIIEQSKKRHIHSSMNFCSSTLISDIARCFYYLAGTRLQDALL